MTSFAETIRLDDYRLSPVNRSRLARYLEVPSAAQIDPITDAEIRKIDDRRHELLSLWRRALVLPIDRIKGRWIDFDGPVPPIETTDVYNRHLLDSAADALIIAAFTIGGRIDQVIRRHLDRDEVYEAFVLKQWAATMTEQARAELSRRLRAWAQGRSRSMLPYDGPGYNGWPLSTLNPLLEILYEASEPDDTRPVRATESGVLVPTNSMLILQGLMPSRSYSSRYDDRLAQCHRCAMPNCRYRVAPLAEIAG